MTKQNDHVFLQIPREAWELMEETLQVDARSGNFDRALRTNIQEALESVETFQPGKANLFKHLPKKGQMVEERYVPSGLEVTERVLYTLNRHWGVKTVLQTPNDLIIVQHPYSLSKREFSNVWFDLCDNGGEVNIGPINTPERLRPYFPDGTVSVASTASTMVLTAETMAYRIWCAMTGQEIDWDKNDTIPAHPHTEPLQMIGGW